MPVITQDPHPRRPHTHGVINTTPADPARQQSRQGGDSIHQLPRYEP